MPNVLSETSFGVLSAGLLLAICANTCLSAGAYLTISNSPSVALSTSDLASGAGTDLTTTKIVPTSQQISINTYGATATWEVDIALSSGSATWPSNVTVFAKRTGNGGNSSVSGGTSNIQLTTSAQTFFTGQNSATNITVQYTIGSLSLANCVPGTSYSYPISYTFGTP